MRGPAFWERCYSEFVANSASLDGVPYRLVLDDQSVVIGMPGVPRGVDPLAPEAKFVVFTGVRINPIPFRRLIAAERL
jgi:hypothetical protein